MPALRCFDHLHFLYNQNVSFQKKKFLWCNCCWGEVLSNVLRITSTKVHQLVRFFIRSRLMFYLCCKFGGCGVSSVCVHVSWSEIYSSLRRTQDSAKMEHLCEPDLRGFALELRTWNSPCRLSSNWPEIEKGSFKSCPSLVHSLWVSNIYFFFKSVPRLSDRQIQSLGGAVMWSAILI